MFEQAVLSNGPAAKRVWTTFAGVTGQALLVTIAAMIPMIWPEAMPGHQSLLRVFMPGVPPGPPPKGEVGTREPTRTVPRPWHESSVTLPTSVPQHPAIFVDPPELAPAGSGSGVAGGTENGAASGVLSAVMDSATRVAPPPRPPKVAHTAAPVEPAAPIRVKIGGNVHLGALIHQVEPRYPPIARQMRVSGVVELEGVIGIDGRIRELVVKSGNPLLAPAAVEAVRQWVYEPSTLNGDKVEIIAPIAVTFRLN